MFYIPDIIFSALIYYSVAIAQDTHHIQMYVTPFESCQRTEIPADLKEFATFLCYETNHKLRLVGGDYSFTFKSGDVFCVEINPSPGLEHWYFVSDNPTDTYWFELDSTLPLVMCAKQFPEGCNL